MDVSLGSKVRPRTFGCVAMGSALLFIVLLFYSLLDLRSSECNVVSLYVALLMCLFVLCVACLTVFVNCLVKQFQSSKECVCCACDPNEHLSAPSICFVCVFVCRKLSPHLGV